MNIRITAGSVLTKDPQQLTVTRRYCVAEPRNPYPNIGFRSILTVRRAR